MSLRAVRIAVTGELGPIAVCHCVECRRASGSAGAANANVARADHRVTGGATAIAEYGSWPGTVRGFSSQPDETGGF